MRTEPPTGDDLTRMLVTMKQNVLEEASRDPAPARRRARNRAIITSTAILLTLGLGAGAAIAAGMIGDDEEPAAQSQPDPTAAAAPSPTATPTPFGIETAPPVDPLTTVTEIVVRPEQLDLRDADGALVTSLSYDAEVSEFIGTLETVLGVAPEQTGIDASGHTPPSTQYLWDGLEVRDDHEDQWHPDVPTVILIDMNVMVWATAPVIGDGVTVRTVGGFRPGDDSEALAAELGQPSGGDFAGLRVETGDPIGERNPGFDVDNAYSVAVRDWWRNPDQTIILAPWNFGVGHA
ncbi:hypothetical protein [Agromyces sp. ZXT2-6]|uniref:hypothetical protein n=1 Tax=Agromyces sp. ZXT2-6 TaxID=3461153 RepID=UPI0040552C86